MGGRRIIAHRGVRAQRDKDRRRRARPFSAPCAARSSSGRGHVRVPSGTTTHTLRPSTGRPASGVVHEGGDLFLGERRHDLADQRRPGDRDRAGPQVPVSVIGPRPPDGRRGKEIPPTWQLAATGAVDGVAAAHGRCPPCVAAGHPDRLLPADPARGLARRLYEEVADLPIVSPHGDVAELVRRRHPVRRTRRRC